jgi:hypothetical protein
MLSIQKNPTDKTGLGYVALPSDIPFASMTVFVKPAVLEPLTTVEDKGKDRINGDIPGTQKPPSIRKSPICRHYGLSGHVRPQCSLLKAQKAKGQERSAQTSKLWHKTSSPASDSMALASLPDSMESSSMGSDSLSSPMVSSSKAPGASASAASAEICSCHSTPYFS